MKMSIFELMVRRLVAMTDSEYEHACHNGYVCLNTSDNEKESTGWWVATTITTEIRDAVCRQRQRPAYAP